MNRPTSDRAYLNDTFAFGLVVKFDDRLFVHLSDRFSIRFQRLAAVKRFSHHLEFLLVLKAVPDAFYDHPMVINYENLVLSCTLESPVWLLASVVSAL